eukprot:TRINITY_DN12841_c0_g1_i1.p1 TRINITY_DN12841_c0_g1~~TRINITY_DN12841_c0_g1_i1.p1  ORF type:complete len:827 (-),score=139.59 TRINITY_DN12841_c0_g1_i1:118-2598(-)
MVLCKNLCDLLGSVLQRGKGLGQGDHELDREYREQHNYRAYADGDGERRFPSDLELKLINAANAGNDPLVQQLLLQKVDVNGGNCADQTPLWKACLQGYSHIVRTLLKHGADVNRPTMTNRSYPLSIACRNGREAVVREILPMVSDVNCVSGDEDATPLILAAMNAQVGVVQLLLQQKGIEVNKVDADGKSALFEAAYTGSKTIVKALLEAGAEPNLAEKATRMTALHIACEKKHEEVVKLLLEAGADTNAQTVKGFSPLHTAAAFNAINCAKLIIAHPAVRFDLRCRETALDIAEAYGHKEIIKHLKKATAQQAEADAAAAVVSAEAPVDKKLQEKMQQREREEQILREKQQLIEAKNREFAERQRATAGLFLESLHQRFLQLHIRQRALPLALRAGPWKPRPADAASPMSSPTSTSSLPSSASSTTWQYEPVEVLTPHQQTSPGLLLRVRHRRGGLQFLLRVASCNAATAPERFQVSCLHRSVQLVLHSFEAFPPPRATADLLDFDSPASASASEIPRALHLVLDDSVSTTFRTRLRTNPYGIPVRQALLLALQLAEAVEYLHQRGVAHNAVCLDTALTTAGTALGPAEVNRAVLSGFHVACQRQPLTETADDLCRRLAAGPEAPDLIDIGDKPTGRPVTADPDVAAVGLLLHALLTGDTDTADNLPVAPALVPEELRFARVAVDTLRGYGELAVAPDSAQTAGLGVATLRWLLFGDYERSFATPQAASVWLESRKAAVAALVVNGLKDSRMTIDLALEVDFLLSATPELLALLSRRVCSRANGSATVAAAPSAEPGDSAADKPEDQPAEESKRQSVSDFFLNL